VIPPVPMPKDERFNLPNLLNDKKVSAVGLTTDPLDEHKRIFRETNKLAEPFSTIAPQDQFLGQGYEDEWNRRHVKQLNDIPFEEDDETEELKNLKRMPGTIVTEEKLKDIVTAETDRLLLDNHYWITDEFIGKLGRMAPNLKHLSFKGINVSNDCFMDCVTRMKFLQIVDVSNCRSLEESGVKALVKTSK